MKECLGAKERERGKDTERVCVRNEKCTLLTSGHPCVQTCVEKTDTDRQIPCLLITNREEGEANAQIDGFSHFLMWQIRQKSLPKSSIWGLGLNDFWQFMGFSS